MKTILNHRPPRMKDIRKAVELRKKGLSYAEISRAVLKRDDKKTIFRWVNESWPKYKKLSTV